MSGFKYAGLKRINLISLKFDKLSNTRSTPNRIITLEDVRENAEKERLVEALIEGNHNISQVSRNLKLSRQTIYNLKKKYSI